jgi:hypothetical protein
MRSGTTIVITLILLAVIGNWIATRNPTIAGAPPPAPATRSAHTTAPADTAGPVVAPREPPPPTTDSVAAAPRPRTETSRAASRRDVANPLVSSYPASTPPPRRAADAPPEIAADFDKVSLMLRDYRTLTGENPVGTNAEIMKTIMGGNPKGAQLGPPEGQHLNDNGELIDHWGTPYFFHQLSKDLMEIHSAGPDRRLGNEDDLIGG